MIPKMIHYCWFGKGEISALGKSCIETWRILLPGYEIVEWNETNFNINSSCSFVREAYALKKYAFVSDYVRLSVLHEQGGIYLDTDVEVVKSFDSILGEKSFIGFEDRCRIATATIGSEAHSDWIKEILKHYESTDFIRWWGKLNTTPNPFVFEKHILPHGLRLNGEIQKLRNGLKIYPIDYLCGKEFHSGKMRITDNTICIHHYEGSWTDKRRKAAKALSLPGNLMKKISLRTIRR
jgi:hypothetical protein